MAYAAAVGAARQAHRCGLIVCALSCGGWWFCSVPLVRDVVSSTSCWGGFCNYNNTAPPVGEGIALGICMCRKPSCRGGKGRSGPGRSAQTRSCVVTPLDRDCKSNMVCTIVLFVGVPPVGERTIGKRLCCALGCWSTLVFFVDTLLSGSGMTKVGPPPAFDWRSCCHPTIGPA